MYKIMIVEDDAALAKALQKTISSWDYDVQCVKRFDAVSDEFQEIEPHLVIMDIMLPFYNGYHWCAEIRKLSKVPVMFLSSASDNMNIVMAVNMGGDDFIAKPVDGTVLVAKIQALLRRCYDMPMPVPTLSHSGVTLDLGDTTVSYNGSTIELTKNEFRILSTMVLVMISSTTSLYIGIDDAIENMHPSDIRISGINIEQGNAVTAYLSEKMNGLRIDRLTSAHLFFHGEWTAPQTFTKNDYSYDPQTDDYHLINNIENAFTASIYTAGAHRELPNTGFDLADDECVIYTNRSGFQPDTITMLGKTFRVVRCEYEEGGQEYSTGSYDMILGSRDITLEMLNAYNSTNFRPNNGSERINLYYADANKEQQETKCIELLDTYLHDHPDGGVYYSTKMETRDETLSIYSGLFFLGIFLGTLFLMETILIIYYKQITEGYEDQKRFEIMQNVGMSLSEVVKSIRSQILTVFFLPLLTAGMHAGFAFPLINRMLKLLDLDNTRLFVICVLCSFGAFALLYSMIYFVTARTYYKIVKN